MNALGSGFTQPDLKEIDYVIVSASLKKDKNVKVAGLLFGYRPLVKADTQIVSQHEIFLWLIKGDEVHILNSLHYNIDYIQIAHVGGSPTSYSTINDEINARRLTAIMEALQKQNKTDENSLVDLSKYGKLPKRLEEEVSKPSFVTSSSESKSASRSGGQVYDDDYNGPYTGYGAGQNYSYTKKKEVSTSVIKRTTKYPISSAIDRMKEKVEQLRQGTYEPPKLAPLPGEKEEEKKEKKEETQKKAKQRVAHTCPATSTGNPENEALRDYLEHYAEMAEINKANIFPL